VLAAAVLLILLGIADAPLRIAAGVAIGIAALVAAGRLLVGRFGGITGDVCGAAGEAAELAVLWALLPWGYG
jgi:cobalamin synthase